MWNKDHSLQLSIWAVRIFFGLWVIFTIFGYFIVKAYVEYNGSVHAFEVILITLYCCLAIAICLLNELHQLLGNISNGNIFVNQNAVCLRRISWQCIAVGLITLIASLGYLPFIMISIAFAFIALIVRVVKNVIAEAIAIKEENDYTI